MACAQSFFRWEWIRRLLGVSVKRNFIFIVHTRTIFLRRDHDPETSTTAAAMHRACYNQLATTLQRYGAQQQQATPCACDKSVLYCVELLWKAPGIRHPSHLLVPGIARLLLSLFCFIPHKTQIHVTAHNYSASAKSTLQPASLSRPAAAGNAMHVWQIRGPSPITSISLLELCSIYMLHVFARTWLRISQVLLEFRQYQ